MSGKELMEKLLERLPRMVAAAEAPLRQKLQSVYQSALYSAPELAGSRAKQARLLLEEHIGDPATASDSGKAVAAIWQEPWE